MAKFFPVLKLAAETRPANELGFENANLAGLNYLLKNAGRRYSFHFC